jgi:hypothetical protein
MRKTSAMKTTLLLLTIFAFTYPSFSQSSIRFTNKTIVANNNVDAFTWDDFSKNNASFNGRRVAIVVLEKPLTEQVKKALAESGISLVNYISPNAYTVSISRSINKQQLQTAGIKSIMQIPVDVKISKELAEKKYPARAITKPGTIDLLIEVNKAFDIHDVVQDLIKRDVVILKDDISQYHLLTVRVSQQKLNAFAAQPYINYLQAVPPADKKLNDDVRSNHKANILQAPVSAGGENLQGKGVVIGVGDNADITTHIDLVDRVINRAPFLPENHGVQTTGVAAGGGILDPLYKGVAPLATVVSQVFSGIVKFASAYVTDFGMVVTNNSYGAISGECDYSGTYDLYSKMLDEQAFQLPELLHVFSVGNDGPFNLNCNRAGYRSVLGGYQSSKNILDVAWGDKDQKVSPGSSYGPASDGRLKPEITATGSEVRSTGANNSYVTDWGSSLASPAVAGGAALLIEKYRQLHGGANPASGLVKAWLMNGARDIENAGPDYKSGFGWMHLTRSLDMVKNNHYLASTVANNATNQHTIAVPAGVTNLKVMLYWHDPAAAVFAAHSLVNDLDLELVDPTTNTVLPWKLDTSNITAIATRGADHINNVEQVTIASPVAGNYIVRIKGTSINVNGSQEYFVVYEYTTPAITLTYPALGEPLVPGEQVWINWDAWDLSTSPFSLEYSSDGGNNWSIISSSIPSTERNFLWNVPGVTTAQAMVRLRRTSTALESVSAPFLVIAQPNVAVSTNQCETYFSINWSAVAGASDYEIMMKQGPVMVPVTTTTSTNYTFAGLHRDSVYYVAVAARINGQAGRRSIAVSRQPNNGSCSGNISDNDLALDSIISPNTGRRFTSTEITATSLVVRIKNLDDAPITGFEVQYSVNGTSFVTQNVNATIPALGTYIHTFTGLNFSAPGTYNIIAAVKKTGDPVPSNDTARRTIQQLPNEPVDGYVENFETAPAFEVIGSKMGLPGLPRWDLITTTSRGRARSFVNTGIPLNGNRAITLDATRYIQTGNTNYLVGTFNLSNYEYGFPDEFGLSMDFWFKNHGQETSPNNRVWARRSDTAQWVEVYNLDSAKSPWAGEWKNSGVIYLWKFIGSPTASMQVRFGQEGVIGTADNENVQGLTVDSIRIYFNPNDFGMVKINSPVQKGCGLSNAETLTITTTGSRGVPANIPVSYRLDGGPIVTENFFGGIGTYSFASKLNLSAPGEHTLDVWINYFQDGNRGNDSIIGYKIINQPVVSSFPYLQNFEAGAGNWYAEGHNSSWQFGTPASLKITKAGSGNKAWKTSLIGSYNDNELSYLYSPCFNTSTLSQPYLSFAMATDLEQCEHSVCDAAWMEYTLDGSTWQKLGAYAQGTNWYNRPTENVWDSAGFKRWHTASTALPVASKLQLRMVMQSDGSLIKEGVAIDDIHVYDRQYPIYVGAPQSQPVIQNVAGNNFVHFVENGKIIASVNPNGNNLGSTALQAYINVGGFANVRSINNQYYHNRNITIKPAQTVQPTNSTVRLYFTDAETDTLTRATSCSTCSKPVDAYGLGITKYDDADDSKENGSLADNASGIYAFITAANVTKVPYDNGYYAQFTVKDFSEFWLNDGGANNDHLLPLQLQSFIVVKQAKDVALSWTTSNETNADRYEVQVAKGNDAYAAAQFIKINEVLAMNRSQNTYAFTDVELNKTGVRYYRLKIFDKDGSIRYSSVKLVTFTNINDWFVYPNPVKQTLNIVLQAEAGERINMLLQNATGQRVWQQTTIATGQQDKIKVDIPTLRITPGVYILQASGGGQTTHQKIIIQ